MIYSFLVYVCMSVSVYGYMCVSTHRAQKRVLEPMGLWLQTVVSCPTWH